MGATSYRRLAGPESGGARAWAAVALRRAAAGLSRLCAARRRWAVPSARRRGRRHGRVAAASVCGGYDSASYARNFDDGAWKAEEGVSRSSWSAGPSLAACRLARAVSAVK